MNATTDMGTTAAPVQQGSFSMRWYGWVSAVVCVGTVVGAVFCGSGWTLPAVLVAAGTGAITLVQLFRAIGRVCRGA